MKLYFVILAAVALPVVGPTKEVAPSPNTEIVSVQGREPLTHAKVKRVLPDGILFLADQGLVKARFDQLAPEWQAIYGGDAQRAAAKAATTARETAKVLKDRADANRERGRLEGRVVRVERDLILVDCMEPMFTEDRTGFEFRQAYGFTLVRDADLAAHTRVQDYVKLIGLRTDDFQAKDGEQYPCYTLVKLISKE